MFKKFIPAPPFEGVGNGKKATCDFEIGRRYHGIKLTATIDPPSGQVATLAMIVGLCRLLVNGKSQREFTGVELNEINCLNGEHYRVRVENLDDPGDALAAGEKARFTIQIHLGEPFRESYMVRDMMAWPTRWPNTKNAAQPIDLQSFTLEVNIPELSGATLHDLKAEVYVDEQLGTVDGNGNPVFNLTKWKRDNFGYSASGQRQLNTLPRRDILQSYHFFAQSADPINAIYIKVDNDVKVDATKRSYDDQLVDQGINEAGITANLHVILDQSDNPLDALPLNGATTLNVWPTFASAAASDKIVTLITQQYGPLD